MPCYRPSINVKLLSSIVWSSRFIAMTKFLIISHNVCSSHFTTIPKLLRCNLRSSFFITVCPNLSSKPVSLRQSRPGGVSGISEGPDPSQPQPVAPWCLPSSWNRLHRPPPRECVNLWEGAQCDDGHVDWDDLLGGKTIHLNSIVVAYDGRGVRCLSVNFIWGSFFTVACDPGHFFHPGLVILLLPWRVGQNQT